MCSTIDNFLIESRKSVVTVWPTTPRSPRTNTTSAGQHRQTHCSGSQNLLLSRAVGTRKAASIKSATATRSTTSASSILVHDPAWDFVIPYFDGFTAKLKARFVDAAELELRQNLRKSDSWQRGPSQGGPSDALVNQASTLLLETGFMEHHQISERMAVKAIVPLSAEIVSHARPKPQHPLRGGQQREGKQADDSAFNPALDSWAGDNGDDPIEPPPQETSAIYSAPSVSTWNAGLSLSPPPPHQPQHPPPTSQLPDSTHSFSPAARSPTDQSCGQ
ncbi:hypothetical protein Landi51_12997 [Colletotrichum acutatum]